MLSVVNSANVIYRKYERKHPKKNYVQVFEIFGTREAPPYHSKTEKELNDFLARDAYNTDMNYSRTTTLPTIPTTAYRRNLTTPFPTRFPTTPDFNNLFTIRPTKPTIKPNPHENTNPDYTNLASEPKPNVQVTKHPVSPRKPTILIQESTDDHQTVNRTTLADIESDFSTAPKTLPTSTEDDIIYADSGESQLDKEDDYNGISYDADLVPQEQIDEPQDPGTDSEEDDDNQEVDDDYGDGARRKRTKKKRLAPLKNTHRNI